MLTPTAAASWKFRGPPPSDDGNSAITEYYIQWDEKDNSSPRTWSVLTLGGGPNANTYQITGLTNGTEYLVRVNAINVNGDGVISETSGTPWEPPEPPAPVLKTVSQFVIHSTHIVIKWEPAIKGPGTFVQWHRRRRHTSASATWNTTDAGYFPGTVSPGAIDETGTQMPISGLTSGQAYDFQIAMETSEGMGPWSNKRTVTPIPPLTVPQDIEVVERNGEILVKIKDYDRSDANTSGYPDKYEFQFRPCVYMSPGNCSRLRGSDRPSARIAYLATALRRAKKPADLINSEQLRRRTPTPARQPPLGDFTATTSPTRTSTSTRSRG